MVQKVVRRSREGTVTRQEGESLECVEMTMVGGLMTVAPKAQVGQVS